MLPEAPCAHEHTLAGYSAITLENERLTVTILPGKGGEIHSIVLRPRNLDVLWKAPWGLHPARSIAAVGPESEASWMDNYAGGWQGIFPNGGDACSYRGANLNFHGEASIVPWSYNIHSGPTYAALRMEVRLLRSPFRLTRTVTLRAGSAAVEVHETITNESGEDLHAMWGHHPTLATVLLSGAQIEVSATAYEPYRPELHPSSRCDPARNHGWPATVSKSGQPVNLSRLPTMSERLAEYGYLSGLSEGRYRILNHTLGLAVECSWELAAFPYLWLWLEWGASRDYPWYGISHVGALEPFSSVPGSGLSAAVERGTAPLFRGGETRSTTLSLAVEEL